MAKNQSRISVSKVCHLDSSWIESLCLLELTLCQGINEPLHCCQMLSRQILFHLKYQHFVALTWCQFYVRWSWILKQCPKESCYLSAVQSPVNNCKCFSYKMMEDFSLVEPAPYTSKGWDWLRKNAPIRGDLSWSLFNGPRMRVWPKPDLKNSSLAKKNNFQVT